MHSLDEIQGALITYTQLQTEQVEADAHHPVKQLLVRIASTQGDYLLRIFCANEVLETGGQDVSSVFYFLIRYPDEIPTPYLSEVNRLLGVLNHLLPLGTLELHSEEGLFFRHMLLTEERSLDGLLALEIILSLESLLPQIFDWVRQLLVQAVPGEIQGPLRDQLQDQFRNLLKQTPVLETLPRPLSSEPPLQARPLPPALLWSLTLILGLISALLVGFGLGWHWAPLAGGLSLLTGFGLRQLAKQRRSHRQDLHEQQRQLRFYWQLLEVESIKLAYQDQSLDQQQQQVEQKLAELAQHPIAYPADILRLRSQMRALRQLQTRLQHRGQQLRHKREDLEKSRFQLLQERLSLMPEAGPVTVPEPGPGFSSEDMLMQNLIVALEYLDFQVRTFSGRNDMPVVLVTVRPQAPAIAIRWLQRWHLAAEAPKHTWMLCFDQTLPVIIPLEAWPRVHELLRVFNRFLPLGALICDYAGNQITLRYRFVRLRGDLSTLLVMEILEVMATFGERLQLRLNECVVQQKHLETILAETEQDFQTLLL